MAGKDQVPSEDTLNRLNKYLKPLALKDTVDWVNAVIWGRFGVGKTVLAAQLAKAIDKPMLLIATDDGYSSIKNHKELVPYVECVEYVSPAQLKALSQAIRHSEEYKRFGVVVLDTASGACDEYINYLGENYKSSSSGARDKLTPKVVGLPVIELTSQEDYKALRTYFRPIIFDLCKASTHTFFITHEREPHFLEERDAKLKGTLPPLRPDVPDKIWKALGYNTQLVCRMTRDNSGRRFISAKSFIEEENKSRITELENRKVSSEEFILILCKWINERNPSNG